MKTRSELASCYQSKKQSVLTEYTATIKTKFEIGCFLLSKKILNKVQKKEIADDILIKIYGRNYKRRQHAT